MAPKVQIGFRECLSAISYCEKQEAARLMRKYIVGIGVGGFVASAAYFLWFLSRPSNDKSTSSAGQASQLIVFNCATAIVVGALVMGLCAIVGLVQSSGRK